MKEEKKNTKKSQLLRQVDLEASLISTIKYFNNNFTRIYDWFKRNGHRCDDHHSSTQKYDQELKQIKETNTNTNNNIQYTRLNSRLCKFADFEIVFYNMVSHGFWPIYVYIFTVQLPKQTKHTQRDREISLRLVDCTKI